MQKRKSGGKNGLIHLGAKGVSNMRRLAIAALVAVAGCNSAVTVPEDTVLYEVPGTGTASSAGGSDPFVASIDTSLSTPGATAPAGTPSGTPIDDDQINLMQWTLEQQKIDAAAAERKLEEDRAKLVVVQPTALPSRVGDANIALYAQQTTNAVGQRLYKRSGMGIGGACGRYRTADDAQRAFLAAGGPQADPQGLDPDGDGFACRWDPAPYRALKI